MLPLFLLTIEDEARRSAYAEAYLKYSQHLIAVASFVLFEKPYADPEEQTIAEDVVQDAFLRVLEGDCLPPDLREAKMLLTTITKNIAIDYKRKRKHLSDYEPNEIQLGYMLPSTLSGLSVAIESLPDIYKEVFILHYEYGYKAKEIARMLKISMDAVLKRMERGRALLEKEVLGEDQ